LQDAILLYEVLPEQHVPRPREMIDISCKKMNLKRTALSAKGNTPRDAMKIEAY